MTFLENALLATLHALSLLYSLVSSPVFQGALLGSGRGLVKEEEIPPTLFSNIDVFLGRSKSVCARITSSLLRFGGTHGLEFQHGLKLL